MKDGKKIFAVSDVHGHATLLKQALAEAGFDNENERHLLVCCGDYFDRGEENFDTLRFFERLRHKVLIRGNHEELLLRLLQSGRLQPHHYINGTLSTLREIVGKYAVDPATDLVDFSGRERTVDRFCDFIGETVPYFETKSYVFVHGWIPPGGETAEGRRKALPEDWERANWIKWTDVYDGRRPLADKTLICGHMPAFYGKKFDPSRKDSDGSIFCGNGLYAVDGGTYDTGRVNVLVLEGEGEL